MNVNVLGREYLVKVQKLTEDTYGETDTDKKVIRVNKNKDEINVTILHEVLHAILFESGVRFLLDHTEGLEESIVRSIEHGLVSAGMVAEFPRDGEVHEGDEIE